MTSSVEVNMRDAMRGVTLRLVVTGARRAALRVRVGTWLIGFAARVMGCSIDLSIEPTEQRSAGA